MPDKEVVKAPAYSLELSDGKVWHFNRPEPAMIDRYFKAIQDGKIRLANLALARDVIAPDEKADFEAASETLLGLPQQAATFILGELGFLATATRL